MEFYPLLQRGGGGGSVSKMKNTCPKIQPVQLTFQMITTTSTPPFPTSIQSLLLLQKLHSDWLRVKEKPVFEILKYRLQKYYTLITELQRRAAGRILTIMNLIKQKRSLQEYSSYKKYKFSHTSHSVTTADINFFPLTYLLKKDYYTTTNWERTRLPYGILHGSPIAETVPASYS